MSQIVRNLRIFETDAVFERVRQVTISGTLETGPDGKLQMRITEVTGDLAGSPELSHLIGQTCPITFESEESAP